MVTLCPKPETGNLTLVDETVNIRALMVIIVLAEKTGYVGTISSETIMRQRECTENCRDCEEKAPA